MLTESKVEQTLFPIKRGYFKVITLPEKFSFWLIAILLFLAPFFKGLFFPGEQRGALLLAAIIFWLTALGGFLKKDKKFFVSSLEYLALALPLAYVLTTFTAANYALSIDELLENLLYFAVFWSVIRLIDSVEEIENIFAVIFSSAVLVSLAGLLTASGWLDIKDGFLTSDGGTIASTFQYKNSLASFLIAAVFIGNYLGNKVTTKFVRYAIGLANFILLLVLFSTQSHGGYIIYAIFSVVLWFLSPVNKRFRTITNIVILSLLAFVASKMFLQNIAAQAIGQAWLWVALGSAISLLVVVLLDKLKNNGKEPVISFKHLLVAMTVGLIIMLALMSTMGIFQMLYEKLHMFGAMERITMYQDSMKMIQEKPILGWGGGGWSEAYQIYQGYGYNVRQTHSYFIQLAIETGLIGLGIVISFWLVFLNKAYKVYKASINNTEISFVVATLLCAVLAIISHAIFDFDLSLAALTITMYTLLGCIVAINITVNVASNNKEKNSHGWGLNFSLVTLVTTIVLVGTLLVTTSSNLSDSAVKAVEVRDMQSAIQKLDQAIAMNSLQSDSYALAAQLQIALGNPKQAAEYADKTVALARYNPEKYEIAAPIYLRLGESEKAIDMAQKSIQLAPLKTNSYESYANILTSAAINELRTENNQQAKKYIMQTITIPSAIEKALTSVEPSKKKLWEGIGAQPLVVTDKIKLQLGIAYLLQNSTNESNKYLMEAAQNKQLQKDTLIWQALLAQKQGNNQRVDEILNSAEKENPNIKKQFEELMKIKALTK